MSKCLLHVNINIKQLYTHVIVEQNNTVYVQLSSLPHTSHMSPIHRIAPVIHDIFVSQPG